jgi:hypothetical protein
LRRLSPWLLLQMPLDEGEIAAILDYIISTWPERIRATQAQRSQDASVD